jgi:hypothetical protein
VYQVYPESRAAGFLPFVALNWSALSWHKQDSEDDLK